MSSGDALILNLCQTELLAEERENEVHQLDVIFISQRLKVRAGDDDDLFRMSVQPGRQLLQSLLHTQTHMNPFTLE